LVKEAAEEHQRLVEQGPGGILELTSEFLEQTVNQILEEAEAEAALETQIQTEQGLVAALARMLTLSFHLLH
jgi:hypothetical protein